MHINSKRRHFATITHLPWLSRMQVRDPDRKPVGLKRLCVKFLRLAWTLLYRHIGLKATGRIAFITRDGKMIDVEIDATRSLYIDYASRDSHAGYEPNESLLIDTLIPKARVFYDIGANWGYFSWLAATNPGFTGRIYSFEISPDMVTELTATRDRAGFSAVEIMPFGLSDQNGTVPISNERNGHLNRVVKTTTQHSVQAPVRRLEDVDIPPPDLIKLDVEDHEHAVLLGAGKTLGAAGPAILFECRNSLAPDSHAVFSLLSEMGYIFHEVDTRTDGIQLNVIDPTKAGFSMRGANIFACTRERLDTWLTS